MLLKATDLVLCIPPGTPVWDLDQHEPLILAISFPLSRDKHWKHGGTPNCVHNGKVLQGLWVSDFGRTARPCAVQTLQAHVGYGQVVMEPGAMGVMVRKMMGTFRSRGPPTKKAMLWWWKRTRTGS
jgi:hypothetical protein